MSGYPITIPPMVSVFTKGIGWTGEDYAAGVASSANVEAAAMFAPILLPVSCTVRRVWWANGSSPDGGITIECGIYADSGSRSPGAKLVSGSAAQGNATEVQFVDVTDTSLAPGLYWVALSTSAITAVFRTTISAVVDAATLFQEASAYPLPGTATPVEATASTVYLCGFSTTASP
jgi:hypothetical protein